MSNNNKAIGLIRVSTQVQDLQQQTEVVKQEMIKDGYQDDPEHIILIEDKESATKLSEEERQGLTKMKSLIEEDSSINCVYVFELSRLSRRPEVLYSIRDYFISHKIQFIVLKPYMRLLESDGKVSSAGSIMFGIFGAMAEQEGYIRKERFARGKLKAQAEGKSLGNWLAFGYTTDEENHIIIDEEKAAIVRKIFTMYVDEDKSSTVIAQELSDTGEFPFSTTIKSHSSSIRNILHNTAYIGKPPYNKKYQHDSHNRYPRLISDELFEKAQKLASERQRKPKTSHKNIYYCKGLLRDKASGYIMSATKSIASYCYFSDRRDRIQQKCITVPISLFDCFAWHLTIQYNKKNMPVNTKKVRAELLKEINTLDKKIETGKKKLAEFEKQIQKIQERIIFGKLEESLGDKMLADIYDEQETLNNNIAHWETEVFNKSAYYHATDMIDDDTVKDISNVTDDAERFTLIHEAIKEIIVQKGGAPVGEKTKRIGLGVKYGIMEVHYENGTVEQYKYNSYTKKCFTMDDVEVPYNYVLRIKGLQHQDGYSLKNKEYRERMKRKKLNK